VKIKHGKVESNEMRGQISFLTEYKLMIGSPMKQVPIWIVGVDLVRKCHKGMPVVGKSGASIE
jgi:hypothetical protein